MGEASRKGWTKGWDPPKAKPALCSLWFILGAGCEAGPTVEAKRKVASGSEDSIGVWRLLEVARLIRYLVVPRCSGVEETERSSSKKLQVWGCGLNGGSSAPPPPSTSIQQNIINQIFFNFSTKIFSRTHTGISTANCFFPVQPQAFKSHPKSHPFLNHSLTHITQNGSRRRYRLGYDVLLRRCLP